MGNNKTKLVGGPMETVNQLQQQYVDFLSSLYREGVLDKQFLEIQKLQDEDSPQAVNELVTLYLEDSEMHLQHLATALFGSQRVKNACVAFRSCYNVKNLEGCLRCLQQMKDEYYLVKSKFQALLTLEKRIVAAGGLMPIVE